MKRLLLGFWLVAAGTACSDDLAGPGALSGHYAYAASDSSGNALLVGQLDLTFHIDSTITGSWSIDWAQEADQDTAVGPQIGEGTLTGVLVADRVVLDLNPNIADDNVYLSGAFVLESVTDGFAGQWHHSTLTGPVAAGFFTAAKHTPLTN